MPAFEENMSRYSIEIIRQKRRTISIGVGLDGNVVVKVPFYTSEKIIYDFLDEKEGWIINNVEKNKKRNEKLANIKTLSDAEIRKLYNSAKIEIPAKCDFYSNKIGVDYRHITIRNQKTRWGSCSSNGNLNFNVALMLVPDEILDYVVVHELCHRKEMNHSKNFWSEVEKIIPDYKSKRMWLKMNGDEAMKKIGI